MLDEPTGSSYYGGTISAPVGSKIMTDILPYMGFEPQYSTEELKHLAIATPNVTGQSVQDAKANVIKSELVFKIVGNGQTVQRQLPEAGSSLYKGGTVILYTDQSESEMTTVPNLIGLTATEANKIAAEAGINLEFSGNVTNTAARSYSQSEAEGTTVAKGQIVTVYFREEGNADIAE